MVTVAESSRTTRPYGVQCARVSCVSCETLHVELDAAKDELLLERVESNRLRRLNADLSAKLAETSHRLIDQAFERASDTIRSLGGQWPQPTSQSMLFDDGDDTIVEMVDP